jgi:hypothetical protein
MYQLDLWCFVMEIISLNIVQCFDTWQDVSKASWHYLHVEESVLILWNSESNGRQCMYPFPLYQSWDRTSLQNVIHVFHQRTVLPQWLIHEKQFRLHTSCTSKYFTQNRLKRVYTYESISMTELHRNILTQHLTQLMTNSNILIWLLTTSIPSSKTQHIMLFTNIFSFTLTNYYNYLYVCSNIKCIKIMELMKYILKM